MTFDLVLFLDFDFVLVGAETFSSSGRRESIWPNEIALSLRLEQLESVSGCWNNKDDDGLSSSEGSSFFLFPLTTGVLVVVPNFHLFGG
jgi:hypothetical protein